MVYFSQKYGIDTNGRKPGAEVLLLNINEIAKLAGVSRTTVSRYLNDGYVSEEKKEQIRQVIEETGYRPSAQAQTLRTRKTQLVGVILPKISSDTVSRMVAGISDVLHENGYQLLLGNTNNSVEEELNYLKLFKERQVDGILFIATIFTRRHKKLLQECQVPVVILGQRLAGFSCVYHDDYHAALDITRRLINDAKHPAYIGVTTKDEAAGLNRKLGFEAALKEKGLKCPPEYMAEGDFSMEAGRERMAELLKAAPDLDSVFCATDSIAAGAMVSLWEAGKRIPEDVRICGLGDTQTARLVRPKLATVHFYYKTSGQEAAAMLVERMEAESSINKELKMGYEVIENDSL